jgi:hypothetical protein
MAKLVDALPSGGSVRKDVQVRILFWARKASLFNQGGFFMMALVSICTDMPRDYCLQSFLKAFFTSIIYSRIDFLKQQFILFMFCMISFTCHATNFI